MVDSIGDAEANLLRVKLEGFLSRNPEAEVKAGMREPLVIRPWDEEGMEIPISSDCAELVTALNAVRLPPRFTAIWHDDTKEFEVIFTVLGKHNPLLERSFTFEHGKDSYSCSFGPSSPTLREIARLARPSGTSLSPGFRNLQEYYRFERILKAHPDADYIENARPTSFWIRGFENYDDDSIENLVRHLNFYMSCFDWNTPRILIHDDAAASRKKGDARRHRTAPFPTIVSGRDIEQHLLILWESAQEGDPFLRFIRYYQILEYAGFYYMKSQIRHEVARAIAAPDSRARPEQVAQQVLDAISADRRTDNQKINAIIGDCVNPQEMWEILEGSLSDFSKEVELDGGFVLPALVKPSTNYGEFEQTWNKHFAEKIHKVRNALVHARESRQATTIAPTTTNRGRLAVWLMPLHHTAARVILYSNL